MFKINFIVDSESKVIEFFVENEGLYGVNKRNFIRVE